jgi:hypothetical protein
VGAQGHLRPRGDFNSAATIRARVGALLPLVAQGARRRDIIAFVRTTEWGDVSDSTIDRYIARASRMLAEVADAWIAEHVGEIVALGFRERRQQAQESDRP